MAHPKIKHIFKNTTETRNSGGYVYIYTYNIHLFMYEGDELSKGKPLTLTFFQCGEVLSMIQPEADHGTGLTGTICGVLGRRGLPGNQFFGGSGGT